MGAVQRRLRRQLRRRWRRRGGSEAQDPVGRGGAPPGHRAP
uniref:Uncharacterized protein n=1 Tax=Arundo donax TaxID=35708 RepID=A0A0A9DYD8_ARUDO